MLFGLFSGNDDVLCIDVGYRNIKVVEVTKKGSTDIYVKKFAIHKTPVDSISNGSIRHADKVADIIKKLIVQEKIKAKSAKIILSGTNIITHVFSIDKEINKDLDTSIMRAINYHMPFIGNDYKVEHKILEHFKKDNKEMCRVFVTAVPLVIIRSYIEVLNRLKLKPLSIDIPSNSTSKLFGKAVRIKENNKHECNTIAVIDFGSETTILNILENGILAYNKVVLYGSSNIDQHLSKTLGVSVEDAEKLKMELGVMAPGEKVTREQVEIHNSIMYSVEGYKTRIKTIIDEYNKTIQGKELECVYITGGGSQLKGFEKYLSESLGVPVLFISSIDLKGIAIDAGIGKDNMIYMANSLGISL